MKKIELRLTMIWLTLALVVSLSSLPANAQKTTAAESKNVLALVGGMVLDGYDAPAIHHATVLIQGNKILTVGPSAEVKVPPGATIIDTRGRVVMPGLIDAHVHLNILGHGNYNRWYPWIIQNGLMEKAMEISAKELLDAGVTSAVDLGAPLKEIIEVRDRINRGDIPGPRMSVSGPWITRNLGEGLYPPEMKVMQILIHSPEEASQAVDMLAKAGVDVIKAYVDLTPADYKAIVDTAHAHHIKVHAHVYREIDVRNALEAGVDVLTHVGSGGTAPPYSPELVRDVVNAGRPVVTTIAHRSWLYPDTLAFPERLENPQLEADMGPQIWSEVHESLKHWYTEPYFQRSDREVFFREKVAKQWIDSGAIMGMGTDSGSPGNFHTESLWREMKAHVDMGMSPQRVISATTRINARTIIGNPNLGTIEPGKLADVIVVDGNPLYDITAVSHVDVVVKNGVVYKNLLTKE